MIQKHKVTIINSKDYYHLDNLSTNEVILLISSQYTFLHTGTQTNNTNGITLHTGIMVKGEFI